MATNFPVMHKLYSSGCIRLIKVDIPIKFHVVRMAAALLCLFPIFYPTGWAKICGLLARKISTPVQWPKFS